MLVKICGMREQSNIRGIAEMNPDFMGFIFYPGSRRYVGADFDPALLPSGNIQPVAVFVNESLQKVLSVTQRYGFQIVQLHGTESPAYCQSIMDAGITVWKAFGLHTGFHWEVLTEYSRFCNHFLFDTSYKEHGGSGKKFDWGILKNRRFERPFFLSGGIGPEDTGEIKKFQHPDFAGIDLNSRFETEPGIKDNELLKKFLLELKE